MFRVNRRTDYAVRVRLCMARRPEGARLSTQSIQEEMLIPRPYLQRIIADLSKSKLVNTFAGPNGGLQLAVPAEEVTLVHIWEAIEGPVIISGCLRAPGECPLADRCPVRKRWGHLQALIVHELKKTMLRQLAQEAGLPKTAVAESRLISNLAS